MSRADAINAWMCLVFCLASCVGEVVMGERTHVWLLCATGWFAGLTYLDGYVQFKLLAMAALGLDKDGNPPAAGKGVA